jgi:hypothetical protein
MPENPGVAAQGQAGAGHPGPAGGEDSGAHEELEDVLVLLATEDLNTVKARLVQHLRGLCAKTARMFKVEQVAAKEGAAVAKLVFIPTPAYMGLDEEERKILDKCRKEQEASKKETAKAESFWKMLNAKKSPYGYGYNYGKFGGYQEE